MFRAMIRTMPRLGRYGQWDRYSGEMTRMYVDEQMSRVEVARHFGTSVQTVTRTLARHGVAFGSRQRDPRTYRTPEQQAAIGARISAAKKGVPHKDRRVPETRHCEKCGDPYDYLPGKNGERFCSCACAVAARAQAKQAETKAKYNREPRRCQCGTAIPYEYRHTRKFCSPECRRGGAEPLNPAAGS
jgi:transposase-like protein